MIAIAIGLVMASCGGRGGNQQSGTATAESSGQAAKVNLADHYEAVERPKVDFIEDWMLPADGILTEAKEENPVFKIWKFTVGGLNKAQYEKYQKTLEAKGMKVAAAVDKTYFNDSAEISIYTGYFREDGGGQRSWGYESSSLTIRIAKK
jgi:hypothetical protein